MCSPTPHRAVGAGSGRFRRVVEDPEQDRRVAGEMLLEPAGPGGRGRARSPASRRRRRGAARRANSSTDRAGVRHRPGTRSTVQGTTPRARGIIGRVLASRSRCPPWVGHAGSVVRRRSRTRPPPRQPLRHGDHLFLVGRAKKRVRRRLRGHPGGRFRTPCPTIKKKPTCRTHHQSPVQLAPGRRGQRPGEHHSGCRSAKPRSVCSARDPRQRTYRDHRLHGVAAATPARFGAARPDRISARTMIRAATDVASNGAIIVLPEPGVRGRGPRGSVTKRFHGHGRGSGFESRRAHHAESPDPGDSDRGFVASGGDFRVLGSTLIDDKRSITSRSSRRPVDLVIKLGCCSAVSRWTTAFFVGFSTLASTLAIDAGT